MRKIVVLLAAAAAASSVALSLGACGAADERPAPAPTAPSTAAASASPPVAKAGPAPFAYTTYGGRASYLMGNRRWLLRAEEVRLREPLTITAYGPTAGDDADVVVRPSTYAPVIDVHNGGGDYLGTAPPTSFPDTRTNPRRDLGWARRKPLVGATLAAGAYYFFTPMHIRGAGKIDDWAVGWTRADGATGETAQNTRLVFTVKP